MWHRDVFYIAQGFAASLERIEVRRTALAQL
jgi:hypothetical protein